MLETLVWTLCSLGEAAACEGFSRKVLKTQKEKQMLFIALLFIFKLAGTALIGSGYGAEVIWKIAYDIIFVCLVQFFFQAQKEKKLLAAAVFMTLRQYLWKALDSFLSCLVLLFLHIVKKEAQPVFNVYALYSYLMVCIVYAAGIAVIVRLSAYLVPLFEGKMKKWYIITAVPLWMAVLMDEMADWGASYGIMVRSGGNWGLYYDQLFSYGANAMLSLCALLALGFYLFGMNRIYLEQRKKEYYHAQAAAYQMAGEQYRNMERVRHDFKNHLLALQGFLEKEEWEKMRNYFRKIMDSADIIENGEEVTGDTAIDALLYGKRKLAADKNILWECDMRICPECPMETYDFCILLGNILDNAIEACVGMPDGEPRFLSIEAKTVKKCFLMEVKNSTVMQDIRELQYSGKRGKKERGLGLSNIKETLRRYQGTMNVKVEENVFCISVLIPMPVPDA
ncbi:MAG: GHKL domain-containing protein [Bacillus sp. (in: Bacteria)]|nr:GHKL domain-containing protein [Bacillus sp. (in: firmicutes)]MCM1426081.1 GHKL domain-containing protein [Eubacterium sp.]